MIHTFSPRSIANLQTCHWKLQELAVRALAASPIDFSILCGHRNEHDQTVAFDTGRSQVRWPNGKHNANPSNALDFAPFPDPFDGRELARMRFGVIAGVFFGVAHDLGIVIRWGQDFDGDGDLTDQRLNDMGHIELIGD